MTKGRVLQLALLGLLIALAACSKKSDGTPIPDVAKPAAAATCTTMDALRARFAKPPAPGEDLCTIEETDDLNGDGLREVNVACPIGMRESAFLLFRALPGGCFDELGEVTGMIWSVADGPKVDGFPPLQARGGPSYSADDEMEVLEYAYRYDAATKRYVETDEAQQEDEFAGKDCCCWWSEEKFAVLKAEKCTSRGGECDNIDTCSD